jgi:hypothetical protein
MIHKNFSTLSKGLLMSFAILVLAACSNIASPTHHTDVSTEIVNASLESLAQRFAEAVTDESVRVQIRQGMAEKFDGDTNVLYQTLMASSQSQVIRQSLANAQEGLSGQATLDALATSIPRLQLAMPAHFDSWDAKSYVPLVGYVPAGTDDQVLAEIKAFDAEGNAHRLDAQVPPKHPVILLSQSERTDDSGALRAEWTASESEASAELTAQSCRNVYVRQVVIYDDHEPWYKGDPEVVLRASSNPAGLYFNGGFTNVNDTGVTYTVNRFIGCTPEPSSVSFSWYEDDGPFDSWDVYGTASAYYTLFQGITTWFNLGDMKFSTN